MNKKKDKVSIIIPIYKGGPYVKRCLDSIYNQDYDNFDVICVSWALSDETRKIISKYKGIKLIEQKEKGVAAARNLGIDNVTGKFFMFVDSDDYIKKDYISSYMKNMKDNDILVGNFDNVSEEGKLLHTYIFPDYTWSRFLNFFVWGRLYRTSFFKENNIRIKEDINYCEDVLLNLYCYKKDAKIKFFDYVGYTWVWNNDSATHSLYNTISDRFDPVAFLEEATKQINDKYYEYYMYYLYRWSLWYMLSVGRSCTHKDYMKLYRRIDKFHKEHNIHLMFSPFSKKLKPERFFSRAVVFIYLILQKLNMVGLFARIYCRGKNEKTKE